MYCDEKKKVHEKRNCLFCHWISILYDKPVREEEKKELENRIVGEDKDKKWFAILARDSKVLGHTLVISRYPFDDFTDKIDGIRGEEPKIALFRGAIEVSEKLKRTLFPCGKEKEGKVYLVTMCDHYEMWETTGGKTTEHLHFHLIPRHPGMDIKAEKLISKEEREWKPEDLKKIAELIRGG